MTTTASSELASGRRSGDGDADGEGVTVSLRVLLVEDSPTDALLLERELRRGGYAPEVRRVETATEMVAALSAGGWDVVIADYTLPRFSAPEALELLRERQADVPCIVVSGFVGEDTAVATMRAGARDYLLKDNLRRLVPAVQRECSEARARARARRAEEALLRLTRRAALATDTETVLEQLLDESVAAVSGDAGVVCRWERNEWLVVTRSVGRPPGAPTAFRPGEGAVGQAFARAIPVVLDDYVAESGVAAPGAVRSAVGVPLVHEGRRLGAFSVSARRPAAFDAHDAATLELLASIAAGSTRAIEQTRLRAVVLAALTAQHEVNNLLALAMGYADLLARDQSLGPAAREAATEVTVAVAAAGEKLQEMCQVTDLREVSWGPHVGATIELTRAAGVDATVT